MKSLCDLMSRMIIFSSKPNVPHVSPRSWQEHASLETEPMENCTITVSEDDIHNWKCQMVGPANTPYAGGIFQIKIEFPAQYPFKPPVLTFDTKIYHPAVELETGKICADILNEGWGPTLNARHCLQTIYAMLKSPDTDHPLEEEIATLLREKPKEFEKQAKKYTKEYAK